MGDPRGFITTSRELPKRRPVDVRIQDWREVYEEFPATALRAQAGPNAHTPALAMTAIHQPEDRQACLAAGMNGMVAKPLRAAELTQALASVWAPSIPPSGAAP